MSGQALGQGVTSLIANLGDLGVFIGMLLESSIVPIPSEVVVIGAGALGISTVSILIFGSLGATVGSIVGYSLGRYAAMPAILKFGKFILIKPHHIYKAEAFAKKYGVASVLIGRILPIVPFKVFSLAAGMTRIKFIPFLACAMIGVLPRLYLLAIFGSVMMKHIKPMLASLFFIVLIFLAFKITKIISHNGQKH